MSGRWSAAFAALGFVAAIGAFAYFTGPASSPKSDSVGSIARSGESQPTLATDASRAAGTLAAQDRSPAKAAPQDATGSADAAPIVGAPADVVVEDAEMPTYRGPSPELPLDTDHPQVRKVMAIQEKHTDELLAKPGVVGTAVGLDAEGNLAVVVMTSQKDVAGIPASLDGANVVVRETGAIVSHDHDDAVALAAHGPASHVTSVDTTARFDNPVPIGVSTGHPTITAGTIGCRLTDGEDEYILSNNHVYAAGNTALFGDDVLQPGAYDGGVDPDDSIGTFWDCETIEFTTTASNTMDAAIVLTSASRPLGKGTPSDGYGTPKSTTTSASISLGVMKYGRTTHQTTAKVGALNGTVLVDYGTSGTARFVGQVIVYGGGFSKGGDSGSLIVAQKGADARKPVGLLFAGGSSTTIANPIGAILTRFGMTVDGD